MTKKKSKKKKGEDLSHDIMSNIQSIHFLYEKQRDAVLSTLHISNEQMNVLKIINEGKEGARSLKQIQTALPNKTSNTTRLVNKLQLKKMLTKKVVASDKRMLRIELTKEGIGLLEQAEIQMSSLNKSLKRAFDHQDKTLLKKLKDLKKGLQ